MYFRILHDDVSQSMSYLLADLDTSAAILIDPRSVDLPLLKAMLNERSLQLHWVLRTHDHDSQEPGEREALQTLGAPCIDHHCLPNDLIAFGNEHINSGVKMYH